MRNKKKHKEKQKNKHREASKVKPARSSHSDKETRIITGKVDMKSSGTAYIISEESDHDVFIQKDRTNNALHGDIVKVSIKESSRHTRPEGRILSVISREKTSYSGTIALSKGYAFVTPDNAKMPTDIFIPPDKINNAKDGQKVLVNITGWEQGDKNPKGEITQVLGTPGEHFAEINSIMEEFKLAPAFPPHVEKSVELIPKHISGEELKNRRDFRHITTFTIDPVDAKDFDDALSIKKLENGNWEIGVHIADVSHYVTPGSLVDDEATDRATSVYLVDRVIPMLPEALSNGTCSLNPNEDKLCFSAVFEISPIAEVLNHWIGKTVINSCRRFSYEDVQEIIEGKHDKLSEEILTLDVLSKKLREQRIAKGSIPFEKTETKFKLDEKGIPIDVFFVEANDAHELIEDFMLLANRTVAEIMGKIKNSVFVYRVHDVPDDEKLKKFSEFLSKSGIMNNFNKTKNLAASFNALLKDARKKPYENVINLLAIRTMAKAFYTTKNIGHYGLGFQYYTHFTSPIRRYPDLLVHRILFDHIKNKQTPPDRSSLEERCKYCSEMERKAEQAERASIKFKQVQYMEMHRDGVYEGAISGTTEYGFFVELKLNKCEGFVRARDIEDDYYYYDETTYCLRGKKSGKKFQLGQSVNVRVKKTDLIRKQIDFELVKPY
jgi:ribonuclease R